MDLHLLLLGKTGMGKSGTGNAILGRKAFKSMATMTSVTVDSKKDVAKLEDGRKLYVVDTPGVADTGCSKEEGERMFFKATREAIAMSPLGYHALLLTLRYGSRLTQEDINVLTYLKKVFGENFVQKYCIIIMTYGDNFKNDDDRGEDSFLDWCRQQTGYFKELFEEVNGRVVLFDNRGSADVKDAQRQELVEMVDKLMLGGRRYTNDKFEKARQEQERILRENRETILTDEIKDETSLILAKLTDIKSNKDFKSIDHQIDALKLLRVRSNNQLARIEREDITTPLLLKTKAIMQAAHDKIEQEIYFLTANKEFEQKKLSSMEESSKKIQELEEIVKKYKAEQKSSSKELERLTDDFQELRDQSNSSLVGTIIEYAKWPFEVLGTWLWGTQ